MSAVVFNMNELGSGQRTGAETYTAERKDDDFQQLRLAALERLDAPKGVPTVMLPGMAPVACMMTVLPCSISHSP